MELGVLILLAAAGAALGYFWRSGVTSGGRMMSHRPGGMRHPLPAEEKEDDASEDDEAGTTETKKDRAGM